MGWEEGEWHYCDKWWLSVDSLTIEVEKNHTGRWQGSVYMGDSCNGQSASQPSAQLAVEMAISCARRKLEDQIKELDRLTAYLPDVFEQGIRGRAERTVAMEDAVAEISSIIDSISSK